jgi:hypothetical protein
VEIKRHQYRSAPTIDPVVATCYKCPFCVRLSGVESGFLRPTEANSDAAKLQHSV